jgi:putative acetyltransferase
VVLGKPSFYTRCGFSHPRAVRLTSPYGAEHTLIARPGDDSPDATLIYPAAFQGL